ncbi:LysM peptidoglycan-binding domain-containing protein [Rhodococcus pyridinivorans]|uniref:LysM peptidoglycan-binding domain-containing protein n=1 Tax=Rhodococcus pyridinivorans TaxID=103816 RepID=A0A7M2XV23_9NOCA|nr:LysM peptidoglycan-binding domain-containing protein [Rhodococcus pyridinivorans]
MIFVDSIRIAEALQLRDTVIVTKYEVVAGDTLSKPAQRFYGDATLYPVIAVPNGIVDPNDITVGQVLLFPNLTNF